ncbi:MAG: hypothetical protein AB7T49_13530 [Oligoflexales bacterium]
MPKIGVLNMCIGFCLIFFAAMGGVFNAFNLTEAFLQDPSQIGSWEMTLLNSAHGHTTLMGTVHILFGLTLVYSRLGLRFKKLQTTGLCFGSIAMGPMMMIRGMLGPTHSTDPNGIVMGFCLALWSIAVITHAYGLLRKFLRTSSVHEL